MIDLKNAEDSIDKADSVLTKLTKLLKKHWLILLLILLGLSVYWLFSGDAEDVPLDETYEEQYYETEPESSEPDVSSSFI